MVTEEMNREAATVAAEEVTVAGASADMCVTDPSPTVSDGGDRSGDTENACGDLPVEEDTDGVSTDAEVAEEAEEAAVSMGHGEDLNRLSALASADYDELCLSFPAARAYPSLADMPGATRFSELRELGLSVSEAARAAMPEVGLELRQEATRDTRISSMPHRSESTRGGMSYGEMAAARELFSGLSTKELLSLYRRVNQ